MRASEFIKEAQVKSIGRDKNGLELSNISGSGYKYVSMVNTPKLKDKFIAFAKIDDDDLQQMNIDSDSNNRIPGYFAHKNTVGLAVYDDIRDAAYVGQAFNGKSAEERDNNLLELFSGNESVIPKPPTKWEYEPDWEEINKAIERSRETSVKRAATREKNKVTLNPQLALAKFFKERGSEYTVGQKDADTIRSAIESIISGIKKPTDADFMNAAEQAFEPYQK